MQPPRGDPLAILGAAACAGALSFVAPVATSVAAAFALVAVARAGRAFTAVLAAIVFAIGAWRAGDAIARHDASREAAIGDGPWPARVAITGTVVRSPVLAGDALRIEVDVPGRGLVALHVPHAEAPPLARGDAIAAIAQLAPLDRFWNEGTGDPRPMHARRGTVLSGGAQAIDVVHRGSGVRAWIDRARGHVRERILATFTPDTRGMARALVLGEDDVAPDDRRAFRKSGLAHLLAVSGMHLVIVAASVVAALRALFVRVPALAARWDAWRPASAIGIPLVWLYADLAGGSGSAIRAAWMMSVALLARVLGRRSDPWRAAGLAALVMTIVDPLAAFDASFVLSALATAGLLALARPIEEAIARRAPRTPRFVRAALAATIAATVACTPVLACMAPDLSLGGIVANVVAVPAGEAAALPLCLAHALLAPWPAAERGCAVAASGALAIVRAVAHAFSWAVIPVPSPTAGQLAAAAAGTAIVLVTKRFSRARVAAVAAAVVIALELVARIRGAPHGMVRATFVDVGQGDAALVDLPDGSAMMIDGGGVVGSPVDVGERALAPLLRARRRGRIDVVVLSHPHPDHFLGLASALEGVTVGELWDTGQGEAEGAGPAYDALLAAMRARGVAIRRPPELCGVHAIGGVVVEVLAPCPTTDGDHGPNDNSFVVRIRHGERALLFAGDAERFEEGTLLARGSTALRADVLKVGHHGSRTSSTPAFVAAVAPRVAVVSCGIRNRFGHPHAGTLDTLGAAGARVLRTDRDGTVTVTTDGASLDVETAQPRSTTPMYGRLR